jgi:hypothetical protein
MLFKLALASLSCVALEGCNAPIGQKQIQQFTNVNHRTSIQLPADELTTRKRKQWDAAMAKLASSPKVENSQPIPVIPPFEKELGGENRVPPSSRQVVGVNASAAVGQGSYMTLTPMGMTNTQNNPLYQLNFYANGQLIRNCDEKSSHYFRNNYSFCIGFNSTC